MFKKGKALKIFCLLLLIIIVAAVVWFLRNANQPAVGTIKTAPAIETPATEYERVEGEAFSFRRGSAYKVKPTQDSKIYTEQFVFSQINADTASSKNLSVSIRPLINTKLDDEAGYKLRKQNSKTYSHSTKSVQAQNVDVFIKTSEGNEATAYWVHGGKLLSVSLTSVYVNVEELQTELVDTLNSVEWQ